jgi:hypothetical protein
MSFVLIPGLRILPWKVISCSGRFQEKFVDPINTTSTAQYAALAANSSCLFAFVRSDMAAANKSVNTINTPIAANIHSVVLRIDS